MDYKNTLLLPKTDFPMRAELPKREPAILAKWREEKIYEKIMAARKAAASQPGGTFILHDGPPFANGDAHMGHALNMVLKDIVLKYQNMSGHYAPFVPGWDCHGLPIEHKVMKELGAAETDPLKIREKCEATARHFIGVQSEQFQRLGVFGDWENPYLTLDPAYEAETLRVFATLVGKNLVYQGLRPVLWSTGCQTALAEAEIEYKQRIDPAVYVKFPLTPEAAQKFPELKDASLLIWTTTPWTLPANLAVAVAPKLDYGLYEVGLEREKIVVHTGLSTNTFGAFEHNLIAGPWKGSDLVGLSYQHPFLDRTGLIFSADFVTHDAGTGFVHIAPGHGHDDYQLGQQHGLPILAPVDDRGCFTAEAGVPELTGVYVFKANPLIIELLRTNKHLYREVTYNHAYPHCWRSKTPIVFRAVKQWFIKMDAIRGDALAAIDDKEKLHFIPENGRARIRGAVETRPDWCISRQRTWGIPLPVFYGEGEQPLLSKDVALAFAALVENAGAGIWFSKSADELSRAITAELEKAGSKVRVPLGLRKGRDTLDVWLDSGTSWAAVLKKRAASDGLTFPADLYLEGSDQHRGWFQSSLLTSVAATGQAPYKAVLTNGFVVDIEGKKLSKSGTGYSKPVDLMTLVNEHGADVLRLWVASQDYQDDIPFSADIFARVADTYRSIRNTLRILLGNIADFDPEKDSVAQEQWTGLDRYINTRIDNLIHINLAFYDKYEFFQVYQSINAFCATDISALYVDVLKDRMYCNAKDDPMRRSAQTVMHRMVTVLIKLIAPILAFTGEETWKSLGYKNSVHEQEFPDTTEQPENVTKNSRFKTRWDSLLRLRLDINQKLEEARREKKIGKSLEACVKIAAPPGSLRALCDEPAQGPAPATGGELEELFIVSKVVLTDSTDAETKIVITRAEDHGMKKCVRCWKYYDHLGSDEAHPELCDRCTKVVLGFSDSTGD
jgi:isoleucyl-tRNA synthetase